MVRHAVVIFLFAVFSINAEFSPNLIISSELDLFITRISTVHGIPLPEGYYSRPLNLSAVNKFFKSADSLDSSGLLSGNERALLKAAERSTGFQKGLLKWSDNDKDIHLKVNLNLLGDVLVQTKDSTGLKTKGIIGPSFLGNLGKLSFYSGIDVWTEYRSDSSFARSTYQPYDGLAYNVYGRNTEITHVRSSDVPRGGIRYDSPHIALETAIDYLRYGPAVYYPLTLSGMTPPVTYARAIFDIGIVSYSHIAGQLKSQKDKDKYIYSHRLEMSSKKSIIQLGINEVIINGSTTDQNLGDTNKINPKDTGQTRGWEWVYLIPFVPFKFVEHYAGDRDNAALSFDLNIRFPKRFRWYVEFFLDDMLSPWKILSDDWGNKWAATIGMQYFGKVLTRDITLTTEYSHVEPWVYTHFFGGSHNYAHFGQSLGSPLGPNSQAIVISSIVSLNKFNSIELKYANIAQNSSVRGGHLTDIFQDNDDSTSFQDNEKKRFLGPGTKWSSRPSIRWCYNPYGLFTVNLQYTLDFTQENFTNELALWGGLYF